MIKKNIIAVIMILCIFPLIVNADVLGDINNDGKVNTKDYTLVRKYLLNINKLTGESLKKADVDADSKISVLDYVMIKKLILKKLIFNLKEETISIKVGEEKNITYQLINNDQSTKISYAADNITIASVNSAGSVKGISVGETNVTITVIKGNEKIIKKCLIKVSSNNTSAVKNDLISDLYPTPVKADVSTLYNDSLDASIINVSGVDTTYQRYLKKFGFNIANSGLTIKIITDKSYSSEKYNLVIDRNGIVITAGDKNGIYNAISTMGQLLKDNRLPKTNILDYPSVPYRGVIEGFYGLPWNHEYRLNLFKMMGKYKLNTYIYAPKDDPKHRASWRELYSTSELAKMKELVETATENNVKFIYAISPGISINLSGGYENELNELFAKCESLYKIGVRDFAILLDDISSKNVSGHARLLNDFQTKFIEKHSGVSNLIAISPEYCDPMLTSYTTTFASSLNSKIMLMWTGKAVVPSSITQANLSSINSKLGRKVFIWWNYPVNDYAKNNLFMGPCTSLEKGLYNSISGLVSNPMNQGYASYIPLLTTADYLWNPNAYDEEKSLKDAIKLFDHNNIDGLTYFVDLLRATGINGNKSSFLIRNDVQKYLNGDRSLQHLNILISKFDAMYTSLLKLKNTGDKNFINEVSAWLDKAIKYCQMSLDIFKIEKAKLENASDSVISTYVNDYNNAKNSIRNNAKIVSKDVLVPLIENAETRISNINKQTSNSKISTNMPTYLTYKIDYASDNNESTYFWSASAAKYGSYVMLDLQSAKRITNIKLHMGSTEKKDDYFHNARIEYSSDGVKWVSIKNINSRTNDLTVNINARYIRVVSTANQSSWIIITEFSAT